MYADSALPVPTIAFNEALLHEKRGQLKEAADIYSKILDTVPAYHECRIRLARNALKRADTDEAIRQLTAVLESNPEQIDALIELGRLYASSGKLHDAERQFTKVFVCPARLHAAHQSVQVLTIAKNDAYGRISLASVFLMRAGQLKKIPQQFQSLLRKAGKLYYSALSRDPKNVYASNGLAVYLASRDNNEKARLILNDVREAAVFISSAWVNLAHLSVTEGAFDVATKLYETCLKKHYPQTPDNDIMTYLARAYYLKGKADIAHTSLLIEDTQLYRRHAGGEEVFATRHSMQSLINDVVVQFGLIVRGLCNWRPAEAQTTEKRA